jgi:hypothetical protein
VVQIVVPLRVKGFRRQIPRLVGVVLQNQMHLPRVADCSPHALRQLSQDVGCGIVRDRMHRIQAQAVEVIFLQPVQRVLDEEFTHRGAVRPVEVDRRAPGGVVLLAEEIFRVGVQVVSFRPEVVVDHVQQHHQAARVGGLDQRFQFLRPAVAAIRREWQHAVVTPVARAREIRQRHQFDRTDAQFSQVIQARDNACIIAGGRKRADVQFVDHRFVPGPAAPIVIGPFKSGGVDDFAGGMHIIRVEARSRVRHAQAVVDFKPVAGAGAGFGDAEFEPAVADIAHRQRGESGRVFKAQIDPLATRRPQAKTHASVLSCAPNGMSCWRRIFFNAAPRAANAGWRRSPQRQVDRARH